MSMRSEAESCAASAEPVGFFGLTLPIAVEIFLYAFQAWRACSQANSPEEVSSAADIATRVSLNYRRARHRLHVGARRHHQQLSTETLDAMTKHGLSHVSQAPPAAVMSCCMEPRMEIEDSDDE